MATNSPLIDAVDLRLATGTVIIDASFDLADVQAGRRAYEAAHIPGAFYLHLEDELSGAKHDAEGTFRGRHPLPQRAAFAAVIGALGIGPLTDVVVYDRQNSMFAARLWWLLRWLGHDQVRVLDGGLAAWQRAGGGVDSGVVSPGAHALYPERPPLVATVEAPELQAQLAGVTLVDARAPERYRGDVEPLDAAAGHIPGARNRFFQHNLNADGTFAEPAALAAQFGTLLAGADPAASVHQCGSGVTACHNLLAMAVAGLPTGILYPGSWSEWSHDPLRPMASG